MGLILKIFAGIVAGILLGLFAPMPVIKTLSSIGFVLGQYIRFVIPLLIIAFVAKGVAEFGKQAGKALLLGLVLAYVSTICAELLGFSVASAFLPSMGIVPGSVVSAVKITPYLRIEIPAAISIMGALVFAIILGLGITRIQSPTISGFIQEFNGIIGDLIRHGLIPVFPYFVAAVFMDITAKGQLIPTIKAFFMVLLLIIPTQLVWLAVLYTLAAIYTRKNAFSVLKAMLPAYFTAMGTMSSAATLPVALECVHKVPFLRKESVNFCIPLFNVVHLSGAATAITMSAMVVTILTKGQTPSLETFLPFIILLGFIEVAAVGVPGGSVTAALGILESTLGLDQSGLGLMVALFMIQDSFGTAANVTGDGALTMIVDKAMHGEDVKAS
ncbi:MAG TPA: cation:dicarboxylase symporter family transporter [Syntrophales bacterium]|nr:cation:dicarboxylase symporter family transporter [Syntrophales bacterium]